MEEDVAVASAGIFGQDEGFWTNQRQWIRQKLLKCWTKCIRRLAPQEKGQQRKYSDSYLDIGFVETSDNKPQCVICGKVLPNSSMLPAKMSRRFEGVHPDCKDTPRDFFRRRYGELTKAQKILSYHSKTVNEKTLMASYLVSYRVAQAGEAHTIAENLIKPYVKDIVECMLFLCQITQFCDESGS